MPSLSCGPGTAETGLPALLTPPPDGGMPAQCISLDESNRAVESNAHDARNEDRGPGRRVLGEVDGAQDDDSQRVQRPSEVVTHHGADHRKDTRDLQGGEDIRERARDTDATEHLSLGSRVRAHELDRLGI